MPDFSSPACPVSYQIEALDLHAHLFSVKLTVARPAALQKLSLPVWIPGSYLVREFAKHLQNLQAFQPGATGLQPVCAVQTDKSSWQLACQSDQPQVVSYQVYALDNSVRTAWLDAERGFFNGTSLCLRVEGQENAAHALVLPAPPADRAPGWQAATALTAKDVDAHGFGRYEAVNYDTLVDCPVVMGNFWSGSFSACGIAHRFVVSSAAPSFDGARLLADTQKIVEAQIQFWHPDLAANPPPFNHYLFMLHAVGEGYGGLEHANSTALICNRADLPRLPASGVESTANTPEGYTTLCGLISHEFFHTWNVKRLRPAEFAPHRYDRENYTELLWFFEGFTSYYDDLILRRAGLLDNTVYLKLLSKTINQVDQTPGQQVQSLAESSFDAWVKYYRPDANTPNATVSYYSKGALVALCLDLTLRLESREHSHLQGADSIDSPATLDEVMRALWMRCNGGPMEESDLLAVLQAVGGRSFAVEITAWVHGREPLPLAALLAAHGVASQEDPSQWAQQLGLRVQEKNGTITIKNVLRGGAAEIAGFAPGDEWLGIALVQSAESLSATPDTAQAAKPSHALQNIGWRIGEIAEIASLVGLSPGLELQALVVRDQRILQLTLVWPIATKTGRLVVQDKALVDAWLQGS